MNILRIIYDWPDPSSTTMGLAPAPYELSLSQAKLGHKVYVLCGNLNGTNIKKASFRYNLNDGNIVVYNLPRAIWRFGPFLSSSILVPFYYLYLKLTKKIDIIHNHGHMGVYLLLYKYFFGFIDKTTFIGHFHNTARGREKAIKDQGMKIDFMSKYFEYPIHKFSDILATKVCKALIMVSKGNVEEMVELYGASREKVKLVESGVDTDRFNKNGETVKFDLPPNSIILSNGGRLSKRKNIDIIIDALKLLPSEYKLILWGEWEEDGKYEQLVNKKINEYELVNRVKYLGPISYFEVDKYFRSSDIFLLPSSYEGLPKVVVEALASGCKCVASGFEMDKKIDDIEFLGSIDGEKLAQSIVKIQKEPSNYENTRKILEKYYSWDSKAKEVDEIYKGVIK